MAERTLLDVVRVLAEAFVTVIAAADAWVQRTASDYRAARPGYAEALDGLHDELRVALRPDEQGTPARIALMTAELLDQLNQGL